MKRGLEDGNNPFQSAARIVNIYYENWSGDYVSVFLVPFLNPFYLFGLRGVSVYCLIGVVLFFVTVFFFMRSLRISMTKQPYSIGGVLLFLIPIAGWLDTFTPKEIFYWYTCVLSYCLGLIFLLIISVFILKSKEDAYKKKERIISFVCLFVLGLFSAGISIQNMTISIGAFLFFVMAGRLRDKWLRISLGSGILISTVVVLLAPGNHARGTGGTAVDESAFQRLLTTFANSTKCIARIGWKQILTSPFFWIFVIAVVLIRLCACVFKEYELTGKALAKRLIGSAILVYSAVIPVCYGYRTSFLSPRTECVAGFVIWILLVYWVVLLSQIIPQISVSDRKKKVLMKSTFAGVGILFAIFFLYGDNAGMLAYRELASGKPQLQWENWNTIYTEVEGSKEQIVTVEIGNEYIDGLMTRHDEVEWNGENVISRSYMAYCEKEEVVVNWHTDDGVYTLYGYKGPLAIDYK